MSYRFKGKLLKLKTVKKRLPNGRVIALELIEHPGAALIIPFLNKNEIILMRQFRPAIGQYLYELPAGTLERGETPIACARREIAEEIGFRAKIFQKLGFIYPVPGYSTEIIFIFKATKLMKTSHHFESDEIIKYFPVTKSKIRKFFKFGKIKDAKTISALALCGWI